MIHLVANNHPDYLPRLVPCIHFCDIRILWISPSAALVRPSSAPSPALPRPTDGDIANNLVWGSQAFAVHDHLFGFLSGSWCAACSLTHARNIHTQIPMTLGLISNLALASLRSAMSTRGLRQPLPEFYSC